MARRPNAEPILDHLPEPVLTDPVPALLRTYARADDYAHALFSQWGGCGIWVPTHLLDDNALELKYFIPPGVQYLRLRCLVSGRGTVVFESANIGASGKRTLSWAHTGAGDTLDAAHEIMTSGATGGAEGPLQVRSGATWTWAVDTLTITLPNTDKGKTGHLWGFGIDPIHEVI